jgi:hypothetical protein
MRAKIALSMVVLVSVALIGAGCEAKVKIETNSGDARGNPFKEGTGWFYHYVRATDHYPATPYADITAKIEDGYYTDRGASNIMIYGPYRASEEFRGLPAIDYFDAQVGTGTVDDFRDLVAAAHSKGITVTIYMAFLSVNRESAIFRRAEKDTRDGVDSAAANMFRWSRVKPSEMPPDFPEAEGGWAFSETAQRWYATSWGYPAPDYANQVTRDYIKQVLRFWLDTGVDGIEFDYVLSMLGMRSKDMTVADPNMTDLLITTPLTYTSNAKWLHAEGAGQFWDEEWNDAVGFNHILINGDEDQWSFPYAVMDDGALKRRKTVAQLEAHWQRFFDQRRERDPDLGVNAWSLYVFDMTAEQRALDAAVQAGMGALYSIDVEEIYSLLTVEEQTAYDDVFQALKRSPALAPGASRVQRPAAICDGGSADQVYAVERTSTDGGRTALNIYNFTNTLQCITVDLSGSAIAVPQTPVNLSTQQDATRITSASYDVELPAFGYLFLEVAA